MSLLTFGANGFLGDKANNSSDADSSSKSLSAMLPFVVAATAVAALANPATFSWLVALFISRYLFLFLGKLQINTSCLCYLASRIT